MIQTPLKRKKKQGEKRFFWSILCADIRQKSNFRLSPFQSFASNNLCILFAIFPVVILCHKHECSEVMFARTLLNAYLVKHFFRERFSTIYADSKIQVQTRQSNEKRSKCPLEWQRKRTRQKDKLHKCECKKWHFQMSITTRILYYPPSTNSIISLPVK